jgi:hypothetical protein
MIVTRYSRKNIQEENWLGAGAGQFSKSNLRHSFQTKKEEFSMKNKGDKISEGLNQIFEIINAKGDEGEIKEILENSDSAINDKKELEE